MKTQPDIQNLTQAAELLTQVNLGNLMSHDPETLHKCATHCQPHNTSDRIYDIDQIGNDKKARRTPFVFPT